MNEHNAIRKETAIFCLVLLAAVFLFWWRVWIPSLSDRMHFTDDIFIKDYATRIGLFSIALSGHLPLWDPFQFGGWPGIANCEAGFFYPPNWVIVPFLSDPQTAFFVTEILVLLHIAFAGLGAFRLARTMGLSVYSSAFAGIAFTFCGFHCAHKKHTNMMFALVWFPWILLCLEHWLKHQRSKHLISATVILACSFFAGHPQSSLYMSLLIFVRMAYAGFTSIDTKSISFRKIITHSSIGIAIIFFAFGLSAVQWLPTAELIGQGARADADQYQRSTEFSLPPQELVDAVLPEAIAPWHQTEVFYWGLTPLLLFLLSLLYPIKPLLLRFLFVCGVIAVFLALGEHFFLYDLSYLLVPGTAWVRAPSRWIYFASLPIALCAGYVLDQLKTNTESNNPNILLGLKPLGIIWCVLTVIILIWNIVQPASFAPNEMVRYLMQQQSILLVLFLGLFVSLLYAYALHKITHATLVVCITLITWTDLATNYHKLDLAPGVGGHPKLEEHLLLEFSKNRTKVFLNEGGIRTEYHGTAQRFRELDGQSPLTPLIHLEVREDTAVKDPVKPNESLLRLFGVNHLIINQPGIPSPFSPIDEHIYALPGRNAWAHVLPDVFHVETSLQRTLLKLQSFPYDKVAMIDLTAAGWADTFESSIASPYISKPFLLSSASSNAVESGVHFIIDGVEQIKNLKHKTGYVIAVIDPLTSELEALDSFDLPSTEFREEIKDDLDILYREQKRMHQFIESVPTGKTVIAVLQDNGANNLTFYGVKALHNIGASSDLREAPFRTAHLVIGKKGAPTGSAIEIVSATEIVALQTENYFYHSGTLMAKPKLSIKTATHNVPDILSFYQNKYVIKKEDFDFASNIDYAQHESDFPFMVYSSPKKNEVNVTHQKFTEDQSVIIINGLDYSLNQIGYNIVVFDPHSMKVKDRKHFNLLSDYDAVSEQLKNPMAANISMQSFLTSVQDGDLIFGSVRDEAMDLMTTETLSVLHQLGSKLNVDLSNAESRKRISHAFMMVKGTSICIEAFGQDTDALLYTRYPGGPRLTNLDMIPVPNGTSLHQPINTFDEILTEASRTLPTPPIDSEWLVEENGPDELLINGSSNGGLLFVSEVFYPGWKVYVDGVEAPLHRLNYFFRGVELEPGYHEVRMKYAPESFYSGALISFFSLILLCGWIIREKYSST